MPSNGATLFSINLCLWLCLLYLSTACFTFNATKIDKEKMCRIMFVFFPFIFYQYEFFRAINCMHLMLHQLHVMKLKSMDAISMDQPKKWRKIRILLSQCCRIMILFMIHMRKWPRMALNLAPCSLIPVRLIQMWQNRFGIFYAKNEDEQIMNFRVTFEFGCRFKNW